MTNCNRPYNGDNPIKQANYKIYAIYYFKSHNGLSCIKLSALQKCLPYLVLYKDNLLLIVLSGINSVDNRVRKL